MKEEVVLEIELEISIVEGKNIPKSCLYGIGIESSSSREQAWSRMVTMGGVRGPT